MSSIFGVVGKDLSENSIKAYARRVVEYIRKNKLTHRILLAKDGRVSSDYMASVLESVLLKNGVNVDILGVATAPCLVYLTNKFKYDIGIMISAPNKTSEFNGIRAYLGKTESVKQVAHRFGNCKSVENLNELYVRKLKNELKCRNKYIFDCGNGASVDIVRKIFPRQKLIGDDCSGAYINDSFGIKHIQTLANLCKKSAMVGFAFGADGCGVLAVDERGEVVDCDKIVYILSKFYLSAGDKVSVSENTSLGLDISLRRLGIGVTRTGTDARIARDGLGNILFDGQKCADGVNIAIKLISILEQTKSSFAKILKDYKQFCVMSGEVETAKTIPNKTCKDFRTVINPIDADTVQVFVEGLDRSVVESEFGKIVRELKL